MTRKLCHYRLDAVARYVYSRAGDKLKEAKDKRQKNTDTKEIKGHKKRR